MKFQNIFRGIFTTVGGAILMGLAVYFSFFVEKPLEWTQAIWLFIAGAIFLLMPDDIPAFVRVLFNKFVLKKDATTPQEPK